MLDFKRTLAKNYINARGWHSNRKLLLIESDDWGAIRMPSRKVYDYLLSKNITVDKSYFDKNDSLESVEDLQNLFEVLSNFHDINGNPAIITAFAVVANPFYEKIESENKVNYHYELIYDTYSRNSHTDKALTMIQKGVKEKLFYPQFHGREHINVKRWMEAINTSSLKEKIAFQQHSIISSIMEGDTFHYDLPYFPALDLSEKNEISEQQNIIIDGLSHFKTIFGFESKSFVAPCGIFSDEINKPLHDLGVTLLSGQQYKPKGNRKLEVKNKIWGHKNEYGQIYWRRNCTFEPSRNQDHDWVNSCLKEIEIAFRWGKPAVINSHRVNFIGSIFRENREKTLVKLKFLLKEVQKKWPEVEFVDTEKLSNFMLVPNK